MDKPSAVEFVLGKIRESKANAPQRSWFSLLPPDAKKHMGDVREAYRAGAFAGVPIAKIHNAVVSMCREHKWQEPKVASTVKAFLNSSDT